MNTERTEKFVNAIACDLEEGGFRQVSGTTLRRSLTEAVASALPLLAEQQGDSRAQFEAWMTDVAKIVVGSHDPYPAGLERDYWRVWQAALAATGKQQVGEVQGDAGEYIKALEAATHWSSTSRPFKAALLAGIAALAARQPVAQAPFVWSNRAKADALEAGQFGFTEADGQDLGYTACVEACVDAICAVLALPEHRTAPPAQGIDLGQPAPSVTRYRIEDAPGLDPVTVYVENYEPGKGRMVVTCYASAWTAFWGAMGDDTTLEQFVASCSPEYVADNMVWGADTKKSTKGYADKVAAAVVALFKNQRDAAPGPRISQGAHDPSGVGNG